MKTSANNKAFQAQRTKEKLEFTIKAIFGKKNRLLEIECSLFENIFR
jgi:hypothetical protein